MNTTPDIPSHYLRHLFVADLTRQMDKLRSIQELLTVPYLPAPVSESIANTVCSHVSYCLFDTDTDTEADPDSELSSFSAHHYETDNYRTHEHENTFRDLYTNCIAEYEKHSRWIGEMRKLNGNTVFEGIIQLY